MEEKKKTKKWGLEGMHSGVLVFKVRALEKQIIFSFPLDEFS